MSSISLNSQVTAARTPLGAAAEDDDVDQIRNLVTGGHSPDGRDSAGYTALHRAAAVGAFSAARELLWLQADPCLLTPDGTSAAALVSEKANDAAPLTLLLRLYTLLAGTTVAPARPAQPMLVIIDEPSDTAGLEVR